MDRGTRVGSIVSEVTVVIYTRRVRQVVVMIAGVATRDGVRGEYRSHGPVLPAVW